MDNMRRVKKQQKKEERNGRQGSMYQTQIKHDIGPCWTLISVGKIVQREESRHSKDFKEEK